MPRKRNKYQCKPGCPGYMVVQFAPMYWKCKECGQEVMGSHICPKLHNHPVRPEISPDDLAKALKKKLAEMKLI